ncbi:hypothetical protein CLU79DRAFT_764373 [Phycomyces nitens]|nr:hypothetical protein CLU79DRAFT_764373 [Phycomyces nitens]
MERRIKTEAIEHGHGDSNERNAAQLANSFLSSVSEQLAHESKGNEYYQDRKAHYGGNDACYQRTSSRGDDGYHRSSRDHGGNRDRYREHERESRHRRSGGSRERRERSRDRYRGRTRDDRRTRRRTPSPRVSRHSSRHSHSQPTSSSNDRQGRGSESSSSVVPLHMRPRKLNNWDMAPQGMEGMTAEQVKQTGLFPLPGQMLGTRAPEAFAAPGSYGMMATAPDGSRVRLTQGAAGPVALNATVARQARRVYVGQIPLGIDEQSMSDFFNQTMQTMGLATAPSVLSVHINRERNYAFVEFYDPDQATSAMAFDGIVFQGQALRVRRPKDYQPAGEPSDMMHMPVSTVVPDTPNKIFIGGLPMYLNEDQIMELLQSFGELRAFHLVKEPSGASKGFAFCEYADPSVTDLACQGLNNMELGERRLVVQRASQGAKHGGEVGGVFPALDILSVGIVKDEDATRVLQLMNMVTPEELENDEEYRDIWEDIEEECAKFGEIVDMKIPRPHANQSVPGLGKIFVRFNTNQQTMAAVRSLAGRRFADRIVLASFIDEDNYLADNF